MILVLGAPDPVAVRLMQSLVDAGKRVAAVVGAESATLLPDSVQAIVGSAASIDFGLSGETYRSLLDQVGEVILADSRPSSPGDIERSVHVRQAAELCEFVRAREAPCGVRFLSSLLVFGDVACKVTEGDFVLGQKFASLHEESLAVSEKLIRGLFGRSPTSIVRAAPVVGDEVLGAVFPERGLAELVSALDFTPDVPGWSLSHQPLQFETVDRACAALLCAPPATSPRVLHLIDKDPLTCRQVVQWILSTRPSGWTAEMSLARSRPLRALPSTGVLRGSGARFLREQAELVFPQLLDRDAFATLGRLMPARTAANG